MALLSQPLAMAFRDYLKEKPVDDKTFNIFLRQFTYDKSPLKANVETTIENEFWKAEKITFDANLKVARKAGLNLSSQLLRFATSVLQ